MNQQVHDENINIRRVGDLEVCAQCGNPIVSKQHHAYQGPDNQWWARLECTHCNCVLHIRGPFKDISQTGCGLPGVR